jgi:DNA-binding NtrC family response regulator
MVGVSQATRALREEAEYAALSDAKVLITGESGVGKEVVARLVHERSARVRGPLITINCAGVPDSLLESELFGHVKGSFTDAYRDRRGLLEAAHGGTVFMDEVGEMSLRMQAMLLRFFETGEIQRVGADRGGSKVDVRVITATHRQLTEAMANKTFREDLYYRLNVVHIEVTPLRERREDIPELLNYFLPLFAESHRRPAPELTAEALARLVEYNWPGNVRELKNISERLVLRCRSGRIDVAALPPELREGPESTSTDRQAAAAAVKPLHDELFEQMVQGRESFWSAVYEPFMAHDLTRATVREIIRMGLERTHGNYRALVTVFNMPAADYKSFLNFLRKHQCHVAFRPFRMLRAEVSDSSRDREPLPMSASGRSYR